MGSFKQGKLSFGNTSQRIKGHIDWEKILQHYFLEILNRGYTRKILYMSLAWNLFFQTKVLEETLSGMGLEGAI